MKDVPLSDYLEGRTQDLVAKEIGITQSGLSQILRSDRLIFVRVDAEGKAVSAYEHRPVGCRPRAAA
ncbi:MAG: Cro/CI family transcriptional regulator [Pseudomonadota bacterium]|nr:Cro/CI family transcriptional regulator [Pseudomonadota bacterium]